MEEYPVCKLCNEKPYIFENGNIFHGFYANDCPIDDSEEFTKEEWIQLMGQSSAQEQAAEPVGEVGCMPGTTGFTMACFKADDVPVGTKLYTHPPAQEQPASVRTSERMPTEADADPFGKVAWWNYVYKFWLLLPWDQKLVDKSIWSRWQPTGLRKPPEPSNQ
jgi:hypothetical protein